MSGSGRIDVHAHYLAPTYRQELDEAGLAMIGGIPVPPWTPELALEFMDAHGIERQLLSVSDPGVGFLPGDRAIGLAEECNDYVADVVASRPGRFGGFAVVAMQEPGAAVADGTSVWGSNVTDLTPAASGGFDGALRLLQDRHPPANKKARPAKGLALASGATLLARRSGPLGAV